MWKIFGAEEMPPFYFLCLFTFESFGTLLKNLGLFPGHSNLFQFHNLTRLVANRRRWQLVRMQIGYKSSFKFFCPHFVFSLYFGDTKVQRWVFQVQCLHLSDTSFWLVSATCCEKELSLLVSTTCSLTDTSQLLKICDPQHAIVFVKKSPMSVL